jgi:hypothetical protein
LKKNEVVFSSSAKAVRIREVVEALSTKPKPRQETIQRFFEPWGVPQRSKQKLRPLSELIEELNTKVTIAAQELQQQLADSAERPEQLVPMETAADGDLDQDPTPKSKAKSNSELDREKEPKPPLTKKQERPSSNGHMQKPKARIDRRSEPQAEPLAVLNNPLRRDKTDASQQSC